MIVNNDFHFHIPQSKEAQSMFNTQTWQSHDKYQTRLNTVWKRLSRNRSKYQTDSYEKEKQKLINLNLNPVRDRLMQRYSHTGRPALHQDIILRSLILFVLLFNKTRAGTSLTSWVNSVLPDSAALQAIIGCWSPEDLPPLGSYFDFMNRLWLGERDIYSRKKLFPARKNGKKPKKNIGPDGKLEEEDKLRTKILVEQILDGKRISQNPEGILQDVFFLAAVLPSARSGLIPAENLTLSGDGTVVPSHTAHYGHEPRHPDEAATDGSPLELRHYADPDAGWGWDSSKKAWYFGHTLYMLCCRNSELKIELPLLMNYTEARRHDSVNFLYAIDDFACHDTGISPKNICLDSAHDNIPTYRLLKERGINALIDINGRSTKSENYPDDISFDKQGKPLCRAGYKMIPWGNDPIKDAHKYRCPLKCGRIESCPCAAECVPEKKYGRTVYVKNEGDLRFHPAIPRDSQEYKDIYSERTACERVNNRVLNNYQLQFLKIRGIDHFSFWTMLIGICIHLDARCKAAKIWTGN